MFIGQLVFRVGLRQVGESFLTLSLDAYAVLGLPNPLLQLGFHNRGRLYQFDSLGSVVGNGQIAGKRRINVGDRLGEPDDLCIDGANCRLGGCGPALGGGKRNAFISGQFVELAKVPGELPTGSLEVCDVCTFEVGSYRRQLKFGIVACLSSRDEVRRIRVDLFQQCSDGECVASGR